MKKTAIAAICLAASSVAISAPVSESDARAAASAFVSSDGVGAAVLHGRTVKSAFDRDGLWIVALAPSGHVILSGSDIADPIVGFSQNDFAEPDPESPACALLDASAAASRSAESSGGARHAKWGKLLGGGGKRLLKAPDAEAPETVVVPPFLESHYSQWQPYNDYMPVYDSAANTSPGLERRGRCPGGCIGTAAVQGFRHFRWPARIDREISFFHTFSDDSGAAMQFPIRFDGHVPLAWDSLADDYIYYTNVWTTGGNTVSLVYDLRGHVAESVRHPVARLVLFADVLAHMSFGSGGSGAHYSTIADNASDWYTKGTWVSIDDPRVFEDIANGVPVQLTIPAHDHAAVGHGWATDGTDKYIYLNYGWGGGNDGYYNIDGTKSASPIQNVYVGHYPRAKPQLDPLPKVCGTALTLDWHFPDFYTNNLSGFTVSASKTAATTSTFLDDFTASAGVSSSENIYVATDSAGTGGNLLFTKPFTSGTYTFPGSCTLTSASVLTFKVYSFAALGATYQIEARFDGGDWTPLYAPALTTGWGASGWSVERVYLGSRGGQTAQFRIHNSHSGSYYPQDQSRILLDDFKVTEVLAPEEPVVYSAGKDARSFRLSGLTPGATYSFAVAPAISGALVEGETSAPVSVTIAGTHRTPLPGEETYSSRTLSFSASDMSETWSYSGTAADDTTIRDNLRCSIAVAINGKLAASSSLSFGWSAKNYYGNGQDTLTAEFVASDGTSTTLWTATNTQNSERQNVTLPLGEFAGRSGKIVISYIHSGSYYAGDEYGGRLYAPSVANVLVPTVPAAAWKMETLTALATPEITSVSNVSEGFYGECGFDETAFIVTCSEHVERLTARPSHLALADDADVTVTPKGNGRFSVKIKPGGISDANARSRMILTLAATDANGTTVYKDLSLRFEKKEAVQSVTIAAASPHGSSLTVEIPSSWFVEQGLANASASADALAELAADDSDGDGRVNWFEYICQTDPADPSDKLTCNIEVVDGRGKVTYDPSDLRQGFKAVVKGTDDLRAENWTTVTTTTSPLHFFTVVIEND